MNAESKDRKFANALGRGLSVLRAFRVSDGSLTHAEIAARTGLPKPTVTRLTYTLCTLGYLSQNPTSGQFRLGPACVAIGSIATLSAPFISLISDQMQALADQTQTLALVAALDGDKIMLIKTWRPENNATIWLEPGHRIPIFGSSSGQAVVAALSQERFDALSPDEALIAYRQKGYEQLLARGFTIAPRETRYAETVTSVAIPYYVEGFGAPVGFSCGGMPDVLTEKRMIDEVGPALHKVVKDLEQRTGQVSALSRRT